MRENGLSGAEPDGEPRPGWCQPRLRRSVLPLGCHPAADSSRRSSHCAAQEWGSSRRSPPSGRSRLERQSYWTEHFPAMRGSPRQVVVVSICSASIVAILLCPPWYWDDGHAPYVSERARMAGHSLIWHPPPAPQDLPAADGWHPVIWWGKLAVLLGMAALPILGIVLWTRLNRPFQWPRQDA